MAGSSSNPQIVLRPQDLVVLLRLSMQVDDAPMTYAVLAEEVGLTASEAHASVERAVSAQLAYKSSKNKPVVVGEALRLFIVHGARYCFPPVRGEMTRGVPTGYATAPIKDWVKAAPHEPVFVWPHKRGTVRGMTLQPLYPSVPKVALR